ncbi:hypothetical protein OH77DRAFT_543326 [Trametes cingulata]|nr:hypothetical protein OH77DRAFT_543326 [Trametes cingulata]
MTTRALRRGHAASACPPSVPMCYNCILQISELDSGRIWCGTMPPMKAISQAATVFGMYELGHGLALPFKRVCCVAGGGATGAWVLLCVLVVECLQHGYPGSATILNAPKRVLRRLRPQSHPFNSFAHTLSSTI